VIPFVIQNAATRARDPAFALCDQIACLVSRRRRTEIRIAIAEIGGALAELCDVATLTIGERDAISKAWSARGIAAIAKRASLSWRRTQRALRILVAAGMVTSKQRRERGDMVGGVWIPDENGDEFRSRFAIRRLTLEFWRALDLDVEIVRQRKKAIGRLRGRQPRAAGMAAALVNNLAARSGQSRQRRRGVDATRSPEQRIAYSRTLDEQRRYIAISQTLRRENPSRPVAEIMRQADELARRRE
jgi:hypothetical protein